LECFESPSTALRPAYTAKLAAWGWWIDAVALQRRRPRDMTWRCSTGRGGLARRRRRGGSRSARVLSLSAERRPVTREEARSWMLLPPPMIRCVALMR
jgi:hypothetical protein